MACGGSTRSNVSPVHRPAPDLRAAGGRPATGTPKSARPRAGRTVGGGYSGCWEKHPRDRARPDRLARGAVVARVLLAPERIDTRGERSGRLGRARHVERALRVRAGRRDRPLARTTTRTPAWRPWSSREGRVWRGVGVHRSCRVGPDWPALPRPSPDAFLVPAVSMPGRPSRRSSPAGSASVPSVVELVLSRFALMPEPRVGPGQKASRETI
jgi:hypothetical protein